MLIKGPQKETIELFRVKSVWKGPKKEHCFFFEFPSLFEIGGIRQTLLKEKIIVDFELIIWLTVWLIWSISDVLWSGIGASANEWSSPILFCCRYIIEHKSPFIELDFFSLHFDFYFKQALSSKVLFKIFLYSLSIKPKLIVSIKEINLPETCRFIMVWRKQ